MNLSKIVNGQKAEIGTNVHIDKSTCISNDVVIGNNTWVGSNVTILSGARIGENCKIFPGAVISAEPQDLKYNGEYTTVEIGDNTIIREGVTVNRGTVSKGKTIIGDNCLIMANAHIGHDSVVGSNCIIGFSVGMAGEVVVEDWANVSGLSGIHQFSRIGAHCMISGLSRIIKDVPPFVIAGRDPLTYEGINRIGLKRRGFSSDKIDEIKEIYRVIFQQGRNVKHALECIEKNFKQTKERDMIIRFINKSERGIIKGFRE